MHGVQREDQSANYANRSVSCESASDPSNQPSIETVQEDIDQMESVGFQSRNGETHSVRQHVKRAIVIAAAVAIRETPDILNEKVAYLSPIAYPGIAQHLRVVVIDKIKRQRVRVGQKRHQTQSHDNP